MSIAPSSATIRPLLHAPGSGHRWEIATRSLGECLTRYAAPPGVLSLDCDRLIPEGGLTTIGQFSFSGIFPPVIPIAMLFPFVSGAIGHGLCITPFASNFAGIVAAVWSGTIQVSRNSSAMAVIVAMLRPEGLRDIGMSWCRQEGCSYNCQTTGYHQESSSDSRLPHGYPYSFGRGRSRTSTIRTSWYATSGL